MRSSPEEAALARSGVELRQRAAPSPPSAKKDPGLGKIQMTFRYSQQRSKLICSVHKCVDLIPCDDENNSDPYVRIYLLPGHKDKRKTQVVKNNLNPIFDETFDWSLPWKDLEGTSLEVKVKNSTGVFSSEKKEIGQVNIDLGQLDLTKSITEWYTLQVPED
jgi:Ca2+-dependent lipid-binding protein